jgi:hypothetical protein
MAAEVTFTIARVTERRRGTFAMDGRPWTLYEVRAQDGRTYTTFDGEWQRHTGERVTVPVSTTNGRSARLGRFPGSRNGQPAPRGSTPGTAAPPRPATPAAAPDTLTTDQRLRALSATLTQVLDEVKTIRRHVAG